MELHKTLVLDPNSAAAASAPTVSSANPSTATPVTTVTSPIPSHHATPVGMPLTIPAATMKPPTMQLLGMNGMAGLSTMNGLNGLGGGLSAINGLNFGLVDHPLVMTTGLTQPAAPPHPGNFTGKVRVGYAAVKTGSPKFAPY